MIVDELAKSTIEEIEKEGLKSIADKYRESAWVMKVDKKNNRIMLKLLHYSVVLDQNNNCIECLFDKYPLTSGRKHKYGYAFFPHTSAKLLALESANKSPCNIEISCSM